MVILLVVSQVIGIIAVFLYLLSYQLKKRSHIVWANCVSNALYVLQYILLGAFSGAIMDTLSTVFAFLAGKKSKPNIKKHVKAIAFSNILIIGVIGVSIALIQKDPIELIPIVGAMFQTGGLWFENEQTIRKFGLLGIPFWLCYNFISRAYSATLGSILAMISIITAMIRYRKME